MADTNTQEHGQTNYDSIKVHNVYKRDLYF